MILGGLLLLLIAGLAAVPVFDRAALEWFAEGATCNDRPCTEEEAKTIATVIASVSGAGGLGLLIAGVARAIGGRHEPPDLADLEGDDDSSSSRMEALARLDEAYGRGEVNEESYARRKRELTG